MTWKFEHYYTSKYDYKYNDRECESFRIEKDIIQKQITIRDPCPQNVIALHEQNYVDLKFDLYTEDDYGGDVACLKLLAWKDATPGEIALLKSLRADKKQHEEELKDIKKQEIAKAKAILKKYGEKL